MQCRFCKTTLEYDFIDLVNAPASNSFLTEGQLNDPETFYPLKVFVCHQCFLVQVDEYKSSETIFNNEYVYFSSYSTSWLAHCKSYVLKMIDRFGFDENSHVVEIASNDGYLLQYFKEHHIPVLGIEPSVSTARVAQEKGINTLTEFFGVKLARQLAQDGKRADLLLGNNVLAHVPDINDFVGGLKIALNSSGIITMEFPHLMQLVAQNQFDTIYHEHFSYLSLLTVRNIFKTNGLDIFDVEEITTHGGSLRIFAKHIEDTSKEISPGVERLLNVELAKGMGTLDYYNGFQQKVNKVKNDFLKFLIEQKEAGKSLVAYGAAAKGNTLLNYCGVKKDMLTFVVDLSPYKQNKFLPASHIPVVKESFLKEERPDFVVILPWNIKEEIVEQLQYIREWDGKFVVAIPKLEIV